MEGKGEHLCETWPFKRCVRRNRMDGHVTAALRQVHVIPGEANTVKLRASAPPPEGPAGPHLAALLRSIRESHQGLSSSRGLGLVGVAPR